MLGFRKSKLSRTTQRLPLELSEKSFCVRSECDVHESNSYDWNSKISSANYVSQSKFGEISRRSERFLAGDSYWSDRCFQFLRPLEKKEFSSAILSLGNWKPQNLSSDIGVCVEGGWRWVESQPARLLKKKVRLKVRAKNPLSAMSLQKVIPRRNWWGVANSSAHDHHCECYYPTTAPAT